MFKQKFHKLIHTLVPKTNARKLEPIGLHSMLLPLEPRMVFDASVVATVEALDYVQPSQVMETQAEQAVEPLSEVEQNHTIENTVQLTDHRAAPMRSPFAWSEASDITFTGSFTVNEDSTIAFGTGNIALTDPDSPDFIITITVGHGTLALDYIPGVVGNQYIWSADKKTVTFEADRETVQKVLDTLKYTGDKNYNGADTLKITVNDKVNTNQVFTQGITVTPVADAPEFIDFATLVPTTQAIEDTLTQLVFNHGTIKPLAITDPDGTSDRYNFDLSISNGTLEALNLGAGTMAGNITTYSLTNKTLAEVNAILANLKFLGAKDFYGTANLTLTVTDTALLANPLSQNFTIEVLAVNDNPTFNPADPSDTANQLQVIEVQPSGEGGESIFNLGHFNKEYNPLDPNHQPDINGYLPVPLFDVDNNLKQLVVRIDNAPTQGALWRKIGADWVKLKTGSTFSMWDVYQGQVKYVHNPDLQVREELIPNSSKDGFAFSVSDGAGGSTAGSINISLLAVNQEPEVVIEAIPGVVTNLDATWVYNPVTGKNEVQYTVWGYEGQQGIPFAFNVTDVDQSPGADFTIKFTMLPSTGQGSFWYAADGVNYVKVTGLTEISLLAMQAGFLRFNHSGIENGGNIQFEVSVTDDGGGEGPAGKKTITQALQLNIRPNNDHPEWNTGIIGTIWDNLTHTVTGVDGSRVIPITNAHLNAIDSDTDIHNITYTITGISGDDGFLLYNTGNMDGGGNPLYVVINNGDKISQTDINNGKISWWFTASGNRTVDVNFVVRDGSITATPVPADKDQPINGFPFPGSSETGWENGSGSHEGGIGTWVETSSGSGVYKWVRTEHTLTIKATNIPVGETLAPPETVDLKPHFESTQNVAVTLEGDYANINTTMLHAWFTNKNNPADVTGTLPNSSTSNLVYRVTGIPHYGWLYYSTDGGVTMEVTYGQYSSFTQADIDSGYIYFKHNSSEKFIDSFKFTVSDGRNQVGNGTGTEFSLNLDVTPTNDTPEHEPGKELIVQEHDTNNANTTTHGGIATITPEHIKIWDVDGTGDKQNGTTHSTKNNLYIVITELPHSGTLYYNGVAITSLNPANLALILAGGGQATWGGEASMTGVTIISYADIVAGKLTYRHSGAESFYDGFKYIVSDNKGVQWGDPTHNGGSVNQHEGTVAIVVVPVNDIPERNPSGLFAPIEVDEADIVTITTNNIDFIDPDGTTAAIQFILTQVPQYGKLTLNGLVLGAGSVFTQADVDAGRLQYTHDGSENHLDSFSCNVSDSNYVTAIPEVFAINITPVNDAPVLTVPDVVYVESISGGIILNGITITDPDYGPNNSFDGPGDTGIVNDIFTIIFSMDNSGNPSLDLSKIDVFFMNGLASIITYDPLTYTYTLVGTFAQIKDALSQIKIQAKTTLGTTYDPDGDLFINITVHDGITDGSGGWKDANGSGKTDVFTVMDQIHVYISPINDPPVITTSPPTITLNEDSNPVPIKDTGNNPIVITDTDNFNRGGNSITLTVSNGILLVTASAGPRITGQGTSTITIEGTSAQINAILATLTYKGNANYNGTDLLTYIYKDGANSGEAPASITATDHFGVHGAQYLYQTATNKTGIAVYGEVALNITPVNDAPVIDAPNELYIRGPIVFGGADSKGTSAKITLDDVDISGITDPSTLLRDILTVTLTVDTGWLVLNAGDIEAGVTISAGASGTTTITLTGTLVNLNKTLEKVGYDRLNWNATNPAILTILVSDITNVNQSNGSTDVGHLTATRTVVLNCGDINDAPVITAPPAGWTVKEDDIAATIFTGADVITVADPDTFSGQIFVTVSVAVGKLGITQADLITAGFNFSGNPALRDAFNISADGKTITLKGNLTAINNALKEITYQSTANFNGKTSVTVYVNDCGLWGDPTGVEQPIPVNPLGMTGNGLAHTVIADLTVLSINDAPTQTGNTTDFWNNTGATTGDFEDTNNSSLTGKTVNDLFAAMFKDTTDNQHNASTNTTGSVADGFAGIVIVSNGANATTQGVWEYSTDGGTTWINVSTRSLTNGLYLDTTAQLRFNPVADFNGKPGQLSVRLVDNSAVDLVNNPNNTALATSGTNMDISGSKSGGTTRYAAIGISLSTFIRPVNDAPEVFLGTANLTGTTEDSSIHTGTAVATLFTGTFTDSKDTGGTDGSAPNTLAGVVITGNTATSAEGAWQYSADGITWFTIATTVSDTNGLFLSSTTLVRFLPATDWNGTLGNLTIRLVDNSTTDLLHNNPALPANGSLVDVSGTNNGGTTRYSTGTVILSTSVTAINDAPEIINGTTETLPSITEDPATNTGDTVSNLFGGHFQDTKDTVTGGSTANNFAGVLVTGNAATAAQGTWEYSSDGGITWTNIPTVIAANQGFALQTTWNIRFNPTLNFNGTPAALTVRLIDDSTVVAGNPAAIFASLATITSFGGVSRYSTTTMNLGITVTAVNDAPEIAAGQGTKNLTHAEDVTTTTTVNTVFAGAFTDAKDTVANGSSANAFAGVVITDNTTVATEGTWQYHNGTTWVAFPATSATSGLYLDKTTQIRFVPAANWNGSMGNLTARLVETGSSTYTTGSTFNVTGINSGGATQISVADFTITGSITAVNDAPIANNGTVVNFPSINEDDTVAGSTVAGLFGGRFSDSTDTQQSGGNPTGSVANTFAGIIIQNVVAEPGKGAWQYSANGGTTWITMTTGMFIQESHLIRFQPVANWNGTPSDLKVHLVENSGTYAGILPASGTVVNFAVTGGISPVSTNILSLHAPVTAVNDAPTWNDNALSNITSTGGDEFIYLGHIIPRNPPTDPANQLSDTVSNLLTHNGHSAFKDSIDNQTALGGSAADSLWGIAITGISGDPNLGTWQYSTNGGTTWIIITGVSETSALILEASNLIKFVANPSYTLPAGVRPHVGLNIALIDNNMTTGTPPSNADIGNRLDISGANRGGITNYSATSLPLWVTIFQNNYIPEINGGNNVITDVITNERQPVQLAPGGMQVSDQNLDHGNSTTHWQGASVSIVRQGGANTDDSFSSSSSRLGTLTQGGNLVLDGLAIGTVTKNSGGVLHFTFNSNASATNINTALSFISYTNTSHNPPANVNLVWMVDDGNYAINNVAPQGTNLSGTITGIDTAIQTITIIPINDAPFTVNDTHEMSSESTAIIAGNIIHNDWDYENDVLTITGNSPAQYGTLVINPGGSYTYQLNQLHPALNAMKPGDSLQETITYTISDGNGGAATGTLYICINKPIPNFVADEEKREGTPEPQGEAPEWLLSFRNNLNLATDRPVVRAVADAGRALSASKNHSLAVLEEKRFHSTVAERASVLLTTSADDTTIFTGADQVIKLPANMFQHTNKEKLYYSATLADGSPLPKWLTYDADTQTFVSKTEQALDEPLSIRITAKDQHNNSASALFNLSVIKVITDIQEDSTQELLLDGVRQDKDPLLELNPDQEDTDGHSAFTDDSSFRADTANTPDTTSTLGAVDLEKLIASNGQQGLLLKAHNSILQLYEQ